MVKHQATNELGFGRRSMLHFHDLDHVEVNGLLRL